ncbi:MBL fold metallo-hydrolase [Cryobacterium melibiosiphilum]|uniref:MBL fold metallo-hydrolase n=1 Tax=Cryobacterium melibiosiphilum TaxID=995039 RepID=A0A3A5MQ48_9MICO|nr:MBL fold metallo-hydrolase [Cryobacterium melibiosiphilum]
MRRSLDLRLAVPAAGAWVFAGVLIATPDWAVGVGVALWSAAGLAAAVAAERPRRRARAGARRVQPRRAERFLTALPLLAVTCAAAALVASVVGLNAPRRLPELVRAAAEQHDEVTVAVTVDSSPLRSASVGFAGAAFGERYRFRATIRDVSVGAASGPNATAVSVPVAVPVVVFAELPEAQDTRIGSTLRLTGTLRLTDPGDAASALLFGRGPPEKVADAPDWLAFFGDLRAGFAAAAANLPGDGGDLLPGLAIGDTSSVSATLDGAMKTASLSHLTAVSGANCAIVIAAIMLFGGYLRLRRAWRIALALLALLGFVVLVTPEPSVLRSSVMASFTLLAIGAGRPGRGVPTLALSVVVLITLDPWLARNYGFALSVLATGGLLLLSGPLTRALSRWMPAPLAVVIAIPVAAQLACQPVLVLLSPTLPLYGVPANLLAAPAAPFATVVGLLACLFLPILPPLGTALLYLAWLPSAWIAAVAQTTATLPATTLPWLGGLPGALGLAAVTAAALALLLTGPARERSPAAWSAGRTTAPRSPRAAGRARPPWRSVTLALLIVGCGMYVGALIGAGVGRALAFPSDWQIAACDIGQGDAVVVRDVDALGVTRYALVDVGPDPAPLRVCLKTLGIDRISLLVLTHYDLDHIGGLEAVIGKVDSALVGEPENAQDERLHERLAATGASVRQAARGDIGMLGDLRWEVYWPVRGSTLMQVGNDGSVTIGFVGRGIRSIFLGDLGEDSQEALRALGPLAPVDVVKVAHHGSGDQSREFYADLRARAGLISVGAENGYGHPTASLLEMLAASGTEVLRTDRQGLVVVAPAPDGSLRLWTDEPGDAPAARNGVTAPHSASGWGPGWVPVRLVRAHQRLESRGRSTRRTPLRQGGRRQDRRQDHDRATGLASGATRAHRSCVRYRIVPGRARHPPAPGLSEARRPQPGDQRRAGRQLCARRVADPRQSVAVRRTAADPGEFGRKVQRHLFG